MSSLWEVGGNLGRTNVAVLLGFCKLPNLKLARFPPTFLSYIHTPKNVHLTLPAGDQTVPGHVPSTDKYIESVCFRIFK